MEMESNKLDGDYGKGRHPLNMFSIGNGTSTKGINIFSIGEVTSTTLDTTTFTINQRSTGLDGGTPGTYSLTPILTGDPSNATVTWSSVKIA